MKKLTYEEWNSFLSLDREINKVIPFHLLDEKYKKVWDKAFDILWENVQDKSPAEVHEGIA